jgi:thiamine transport system substrate-binding protein
VTLQTHDSFALSEGILESFTARTGVTVEVLTSGDAGTLVNTAILSRDHPLADVLYGIDNTFLSRALEAGIFEAYRASDLSGVPAELQLDDAHRVTPIDYGDVCVNLDLEAFGDGGLPVPQHLEDLTDPVYRGTLVVEDPATSSPGLAFLLATIARFGESGERTWRDYWSELRANEVLVAGSWDDAYYGEFSGGASGEGERPMVVSYGSSPVAEVYYSDPQPAEAPTGVLLDGCFRQVEFAGVLAGTDAPEAARALVEFLLSPEVQADIPLNMFVLPALASVELPEVFLAHAQLPEAPLSVAPEAIEANRERWIEEWVETVLR